MVFGVFDGLHEGHRYFLTEAKKLGRLLIVIARDSAVKNLKNKMPRVAEQSRRAAVQTLLPSATVVLGDETQGSYDVIKTHHPDMIALGHDQQALESDLRAKMEDGTIPEIPVSWIMKHETRNMQKLQN